MQKLLRLPEVAGDRTAREHPSVLAPPGHRTRSIKLGRRVVYRECDVVAWIEEQFDAG